MNNLQAWSVVKDKASQIEEAGAVSGATSERELYAALAPLVAQVLALIHKGAEITLITPQVDLLTVATSFKE